MFHQHRTFEFERMVVGRALRATGCASCRLSLIRSFTSIAGPGIRAPHISTRLPRPRPSTRFRHSSQIAHDSQENGKGKHDGKEARTEDDGFEEDLEKYFEEGLDVAQGAKDGEVAAVPWYLQVESPQGKPQPLSERQKIPELPETPPPILEPLLQQISVDLGMDDLKLLDLRKLDPPPALGANLLMIIGTARSEKHLHVSADRLCRWLRSTYKLRPDADGLLGRNELKLKLKRKAKRAKLMGTAADETGDDGVRTGWVCVDVGVVEPSEDAVEAPQRENFIGFGRRVDGIRIVVQMLTEEKREQIDLEHLWGGILKRGGHQEIVGTGEEGAAQLSTPSNSGVPSIEGPTSKFGQRRAMHTFARQFSDMQELGPPPSSTSLHELSSRSPLETFDLNAIQQSALADINAGDFEKAKNVLMDHSLSVPALKEDRWRNVFLTLMRIYIQSIPEDQALEELALPSEGSDPTPFMACFQSAISHFPTQFGAESEIWLHCFARDLAHPSYTLYDLGGFVNKLQGYGIPISRDSYITLIRSALSPRNNLQPHLERSSFSTDIVLDILRVMQDQGLEILDEDMFVDLLELTEPAPGYSYRKGYSDATHVYDLEVQKLPNIQRRLHLLMMKLPLPLFREESRIRLLNIYARNHHWWEFFDVFRMAPRACKPNTPAMYAYMFACVANTGHQRGCMAVLRNWLPDMSQEDPPVKLNGDVAEAVKACLRVADPHVEQDAAEVPELKGEWLSIWRQCHLEG